MLRVARLLILASASALAALGALAACDAFGDGATSEADAAPQAEAAAPVEAGGRPLSCPLGALLCDDFERDDLLQDGKWRVDGALARLALDPSVSTSPTRSLRASPVAGSGGALHFELSGFSLPAVEVSFSLRTDSIAGDFTQVLVLELDPGKSFVLAEIRGDSLNLAEQFIVTDTSATGDAGLVYDTRSVARLPIQAFERYRLRVDIGRRTASLDLAGGTVSEPRALRHAHASITSVLVGAPFGGTRLASHWIDDVVVSP